MGETMKKTVAGFVSLAALLALGLTLNALFAPRAGQRIMQPQTVFSETDTPSRERREITLSGTPEHNPALAVARSSTTEIKPTETPVTTKSDWPILLPDLEVPLEPAKTGLAHVDVTSIRVTQVITIPVPCAVKFAPDGHRFACNLQLDAQTWLSGQLWLGSLEHGLERQVAEGYSIRQWSPDGRGFFFATRPPGPNRKYNLYFFDLNRGSQQLLAKGVDNDRVEYIPGTREVAYIQQGELHFRSLETGAERVLSRRMFVAPQNFTHSIFRISPDGKRAAIVDILPQGRSISIVDLESGDEIRIAGDSDLRAEWYPMAWSSDGRYLAYGVFPSPRQMPELWIVNADGSNPRKLYTENVRGRYEFLQWLPNGDAIFLIFVPRGTDAYKQARYQVISAHDGTRQILFTGGGYLELVKGGRFLAFYSAEDVRFGSHLAILAYSPEEAQR